MRPSVPAGLMCARDGAAMVAPMNTANPQPTLMNSEPALLPYDFFSTAAATTPQPISVRPAVPSSSQRKISPKFKAMYVLPRAEGRRGGCPSGLAAPPTLSDLRTLRHQGQPVYRALRRTSEMTPLGASSGTSGDL